MNEKIIGDVKVVQATFGVKMDDVPKVGDPQLGSTALLELGVYTLHLADIAFEGERPERIEASGHLFDTGVDHTVNVSLLYSNKRMAHLLFTTGILFSSKQFVSRASWGNFGTGEILPRIRENTLKLKLHAFLAMYF